MVEAILRHIGVWVIVTAMLSKLLESARVFYRRADRCYGRGACRETCFDEGERDAFIYTPREDIPSFADSKAP